MKENADKHEVHIAREMYDQLLSLASIGANESNQEWIIAGIERHARKYNTTLHNERVEEVRLINANKKRRRTEQREFLRENTGKTFYTVGSRGLVEVVVLGQSPKHKDCVHVRNAYTKETLNIQYDALRSELPKNSFFNMFIGCWQQYDNDEIFKLDAGIRAIQATSDHKDLVILSAAGGKELIFEAKNSGVAVSVMFPQRGETDYLFDVTIKSKNPVIHLAQGRLHVKQEHREHIEQVIFDALVKSQQGAHAVINVIKEYKKKIGLPTDAYKLDDDLSKPILQKPKFE